MKKHPPADDSVMRCPSCGHPVRWVKKLQAYVCFKCMLSIKWGEKS